MIEFILSNLRWKSEVNALLAYVFWHWKQAGVTEEEYETRQRNFHAALAAAPPDSFFESFSGAISQAAWAANGGNAYEDWYLVQDFAALGLLNEGAISASRTAPHDAAAAVAADGTAAVYGLRLGKVLNRPQFAYWFSKPDGMSYRELDAQVAPLVDQYQAALWIRQMVLGPALEFCLHAPESVSFASIMKVQTIPLRLIWPA
jgi:hypothetical protein